MRHQLQRWSRDRARQATQPPFLNVDCRRFARSWSRADRSKRAITTHAQTRQRRPEAARRQPLRKARSSPRATPDSWKGLPKVTFPSRQWFSKVTEHILWCLKKFNPRLQSGVVRKPPHENATGLYVKPSCCAGDHCVVTFTCLVT